MWDSLPFLTPTGPAVLGFAVPGERNTLSTQTHTSAR